MNYTYKVHVIVGEISKSSENELQQTLNDFALAGWEFVSMTPQVGSEDYLSNGPESLYCVDKVYVAYNVLIFRRPK